jgi:hypothetical protein
MKKILGLMLALSFVLCACGLTKEKLGLKRDTPDASKVEVRQPLDLPPDFSNLPD